MLFVKIKETVYKYSYILCTTYYFVCKWLSAPLICYDTQTKYAGNAPAMRSCSFTRQERDNRNKGKLTRIKKQQGIVTKYLLDIEMCQPHGWLYTAVVSPNSSADENF